MNKFYVNIYNGDVNRARHFHRYYIYFESFKCGDAYSLARPRSGEECQLRIL